MIGATKYVMKQSSVPLMEAAFNSSYDILLSQLENYAEEEAKNMYGYLFGVAMNSESLDYEAFRRLASDRIRNLIEAIYLRAEGLFSSWYIDSFDHLGSFDRGIVDRVIRESLTESASLRADSVSDKIFDTINNIVESNTNSQSFDLDNTIQSLSKRTSVTESNSSAGSIIESTAVSMFGRGQLFKRWITVGDERVRHSHRLVASNNPIPVDSLYLVGDVYMRFPSDPQAFGGNVAKEVINCRCRSLILPRTRFQHNSFSLNNFLNGTLY